MHNKPDMLYFHLFSKILCQTLNKYFWPLRTPALRAVVSTLRGVVPTRRSRAGSLWTGGCDSACSMKSLLHLFHRGGELFPFLFRYKSGIIFVLNPER